MIVDGARLLEAYFSDIHKIRPFLSAYGFQAPSAEQIRKWKSRGVPGRWLVDVMCCLEIEYGKPVPLTPFVREAS